MLVPWGGGGLTCGIASALKQQRPATRVIAVEPETGAPLTASLPAGESQAVDYRASFVDGSGSRALLPKMWGLAQELIDGAVSVSLDDTAAAVRLLAERARVVAEGAGALSLAAARAGHGRHGQGRLHRLGRQHRRLAARQDPGRRDPGLIAGRIGARQV